MNNIKVQSQVPNFESLVNSDSVYVSKHINNDLISMNHRLFSVKGQTYVHLYTLDATTNKILDYHRVTLADYDSELENIIERIEEMDRPNLELEDIFDFIEEID